MELVLADSELFIYIVYRAASLYRQRGCPDLDIRGRQRCCEENEGIELMLADPVSCDPHAPSAGFSRQEAGLLSSPMEVHVDRRITF